MSDAYTQADALAALAAHGSTRKAALALSISLGRWQTLAHPERRIRNGRRQTERMLVRRAERPAKTLQGQRTRDEFRKAADAKKAADRAAWVAQCTEYNALRQRLVRVTDRAADVRAAPTRPVYRPGVDPKPEKYVMRVVL